MDWNGLTGMLVGRWVGCQDLRINLTRISPAFACPQKWTSCKTLADIDFSLDNPSAWVYSRTMRTAKIYFAACPTTSEVVSLKFARNKMTCNCSSCSTRRANNDPYLGILRG